MIPNNERGTQVSDDNTGTQRQQKPRSPLAGPPIDPNFVKALDDLIALAKQGQKLGSEVFNPSGQWLISHMPIFQGLPEEEQQRVRQEVHQLQQEAQETNAAGRAATRVWPEEVVRLDNGGLDFFSQLGVVRRPDLTQYFIDGFELNRDALAFSEANQMLFAQVFPYISQRMRECFASGQTIIQTDRQIGDAPGRSFHARQLLFGVRYLQVPYMWRQLTFSLPESQLQQEPDILEVSI